MFVLKNSSWGPLEFLVPNTIVCSQKLSKSYLKKSVSSNIHIANMLQQ